MGWASGSDLYSQVIDVLKEYIPKKEKRVEAHEILIQAFESMDWDTEVECLGEDEAFDEAMKNLYPNWFEEER